MLTLQRRLVSGFLVLALAGCGQVVTKPTATPEPTPTPEVAEVVPTATLPPTATPAPYTPEPTPTPTVTPTPLIYIVQSGDTLSGIAKRYRVSASVLQEANGIEDPRRLQVGQALIIPQEEEAQAASEPTPTPTPLPFTVENMTFARAPTGGLWCLGEVLNTSDVDIEQVQVAVNLLDDKAQIIASASNFVEMDLLAPGQRSPFAILFSQPPSQFASYQTTPLSAVPAHVGGYYRDLAVQEARGEGERYAVYRVEGKVVNIGPEDAVGVTVVVTAYDALGRVVGVRRAPPRHNVIPRGGHSEFAMEIIPVSGPVVTYTVQAQGRRVLPTLAR
jgi:LysM repeat protein